MNTYTCDLCGETYEKTRSDEECWKETEELMPETIHDDMGILCDDCWQDFMEWFKKLNTEQKKKMREDYIKENYN